MSQPYDPQQWVKTETARLLRLIEPRLDWPEYSKIGKAAQELDAPLESLIIARIGCYQAGLDYSGAPIGSPLEVSDRLKQAVRALTVWQVQGWRDTLGQDTAISYWKGRLDALLQSKQEDEYA
jgi:hypothetical protein